MSPQPNSQNFISVIENNKGIIYKIANSYCKDPEDRKDLVQEIIFQLWKSFGNYDNQYKLSTWIYRIALNVAISFYRKSSTRKNSSIPLHEVKINFAEDKDHAELENNISMLKQFINELNELDRALMILYLEEKSQREMAEILGISETNVSTKISRVKGKLKLKFSQINE